MGFEARFQRSGRRQVRQGRLLTRRPERARCTSGAWRDRKAGKQRLYGLDARGLRPVHEWTGGFERFWNESFDRLDAYVQDLKQARQEQ
jgi:hypothetical protein